jgi:molecular chaperone DnaK
VPQIEVTFDIDANGILNVTAKDQGTGKEQSISITGASTLPDNEVEKMVREAEANAEADKERREKIDRKNQADSLAYQAEKQMQELGDKVPADDKTKIEGLIKDIREAVSSEDDARIQSVTTELQQALYNVSSNLYQQAGGAPGEPGAPGGPGGPGGPDGPDGDADDVIDADFTESK